MTAPRTFTRRRLLLLLVAVVALLAGVLLAWPRGPKEPVYEGKHLSLWVKQAWEGGVGPEVNAASNAIVAIGTNALPWLMYQLKKPLPLWKTQVGRFAGWQRAVQLGIEHPDMRLFVVANAFSLLGSNVALALPALGELLDMEDRCIFAASAMAGAGELALPYFTAGVESTNEARAGASLHGMALLGRENDSVLSSLVEFARRQDYPHRYLALINLSIVPDRPEICLPVFVEAVADTNFVIQDYASNHISSLRLSSKSAIPAFLPFLSNSDPRIMLTASNALFRIDSNALPKTAP